MMIHQFRIYPDRRRSPQFYKVFIFPNKEAMHAFRREQSKLGLKHTGCYNWSAMATHWKPGQPGLKSLNHTGQILFHQGQLGAGVVSHEMTHAALYWLMARKGRVVRGGTNINRLDEPLAWTVGNLTVQFWRAFWRLGLDQEMKRSASSVRQKTASTKRKSSSTKRTKG